MKTMKSTSRMKAQIIDKQLEFLKTSITLFICSHLCTQHHRHMRLYLLKHINIFSKDITRTNMIRNKSYTKIK